MDRSRQTQRCVRYVLPVSFFCTVYLNQVVYHLRKSKKSGIFRGFAFSGKFKGKHNFHRGYLEKRKLIPGSSYGKASDMPEGNEASNGTYMIHK